MNQRAARPDLPDKLRKGLLDRLVRPVDVEVVGVGRRHHRHVGIQPQERPVELVGLDSQSFPPSPSTRLPPKFFEMPPEKSRSRRPSAARSSHAAIVEVVVVLPCVPATAITVFALRQHARASANASRSQNPSIRGKIANSPTDRDGIGRRIDHQRIRPGPETAPGIVAARRPRKWTAAPSHSECAGSGPKAVRS